MEKPAKAILIIFYRNPAPGAVKTRLAATMGNEKALDIYKKLALHTRDITSALAMDKVVYYSDFIDNHDIWPPSSYSKALQRGVDLGERMKQAFHECFERGYNRVCIAGTDCLELDTETIERAFQSLELADVVIGPARDGGYYLLGTRRFFPQLFHDKKWSTSNVFENTIHDLRTLGLSHAQLQTLSDVDVESDVPDEWKGIS